MNTPECNIVEQLGAFVDTAVRAERKALRSCARMSKIISSKTAKGEDTSQLKSKLQRGTTAIRKGFDLVITPCMELMQLLCQAKPACDYAGATRTVHRAVCGFAALLLLCNDDRFLTTFTTTSLHLSRNYRTAVMEELFFGRWASREEDPFAVLRRNARERVREERIAGGPVPATDAMHFISPTAEPLETLMGTNPWAECDSRLLLTELLKKSDLPELSQLVAVARYELAHVFPSRYSRTAIADHLFAATGEQYTEMNLKTAQLALTRAAADLRRMLRGIPPKPPVQ